MFMSAKPAVDIRFATTRFAVFAISGTIDTLTAKLVAVTELNTAAKWKAFFEVDANGKLPETMMFYFNVGAVAATLGSDANATVTTLPQSQPTPWFTGVDGARIKISGSIEIVMMW